MTLDRYGHLFSEGLDHLADCRDRACAKASVYPACTDASAAGPGKAKGLVCDQALLVEVGRLELHRAYLLHPRSSRWRRSDL
jgi:hypothetical protein